MASASSKLPRTWTHLGAVHQGLGQLAQGDVAFGDEHGTGHAGAAAA